MLNRESITQGSDEELPHILRPHMRRRMGMRRRPPDLLGLDSRLALQFHLEGMIEGSVLVALLGLREGLSLGYLLGIIVGSVFDT